MRYVDILFYSCLLSYLFASIIGWLNYRFLDQAARIIVILLSITFLSEIIGRILYILGSEQSYAYHFYCVIDFFLMAYYFIIFLKFPTTKIHLKAIALLISLLGILNCKYLQPLNTFNSNMLMLESFVVIGMSMYALYRMLINNELYDILNYPHFWLWTFFLLLYSCSFFFWPFIKFFYVTKHEYYFFATYFQELINILCYLGIGLTFYFYP